MTLTPETIGGVTVGAIAVAGMLKKLGILNLPLRRNNNSGDPFSIADCHERHGQLSQRIQVIAATQIENKSRSEGNKARLEKGVERFEKLEDKIKTIDTNVAVIKERISQQHKHLTDTMQLILSKLN